MNGSAPRRQLPYMLAGTTVVLLPLLLVKVAESAIGFSSPLLSIAAVVALSFVVANVGAAYGRVSPARATWSSRTSCCGAGCVVCEHRATCDRGERLLGLGRSGNSALHTEVSQEQQAELLERLAALLKHATLTPTVTRSGSRDTRR